MKSYEDYIYKLKQFTQGGIDVKKLNEINNGIVTRLILRNQWNWREVHYCHTKLQGKYHITSEKFRQLQI
jgi:hypothetical protein